MTDETDKTLADDVRRAVGILNHAMQRACEAGIAVELDVHEVSTLDKVPNHKILNVSCRKAL